MFPENPFFHLGKNAKSAWANICVSGLSMFAMMNIIIIHGGWLGTEYGIGPKSLGFYLLYSLDYSICSPVFL